jgi:negative regulator of flagellin synthesis FlgM
MANNVDSTRSNFFPHTGNAQVDRATKTEANPAMKRNNGPRKAELDRAAMLDAKVDIPEAVKDFSKIKRTVDAAPNLDKTSKINDLKSRIQAGTYQVDYDGLAEKMLESEF